MSAFGHRGRTRRPWPWPRRVFVRVEGIASDSWELAEHVDQGQRPPAGHSRRHIQQSGELVAQGQRRPRRRPRRSHRSVEGDVSPHGERERERKRRYYIRGFEFTTHSGLGRFGVGVASPATSSTIIMPFTWASVVPAGTVPKDYPRHLDGLSARPVASVSRRSPRSRAHRGHRAGFFGVGRACRPGPASAASRSLQKIVGAIVGRRLELGANTYRVLVHPTPQAGFGEFLLKPSLFVMRRSEDRPAIGMLRRT